MNVDEHAAVLLAVRVNARRGHFREAYEGFRRGSPETIDGAFAALPSSAAPEVPGRNSREHQ